MPRYHLGYQTLKPSPPKSSDKCSHASVFTFTGLSNLRIQITWYYQGMFSIYKLCEQMLVRKMKPQTRRTVFGSNMTRSKSGKQRRRIRTLSKVIKVYHTVCLFETSTANEKKDIVKGFAALIQLPYLSVYPSPFFSLALLLHVMSCWISCFKLVVFGTTKEIDKSLKIELLKLTSFYIAIASSKWLVKEYDNRATWDIFQPT